MNPLNTSTLSTANTMKQLIGMNHKSMEQQHFIKDSKMNKIGNTILAKVE